MVDRYKLYINGEWVNSASGELFTRANPADPNEVIGEFQKGNEKDIDKAVDAAEKAFEKWSETPAPKRGDILFKIARLLEEQKEELAKTMTREMGKVLVEARGDVQEAIDMAYYMAGEGRRLFGHTTTSELKEKFAMTVRKPLGVCGLITPWNFPIAIPSWKILPALICGNTVVFKPSSDTPLCAIKFVEVLEKAGVPKGVVNMVTGPGGRAGMHLVKHEKVRAISFTGHRDTGALLLKEAGIKKVSLELGGKNPIIIMDDADLDLAVDGVVWGGYGTTGQRCTAASRVIIHSKVKANFEKMLVKRIGKLKLGNGLKKGTDVGPLVNKAAQERSKKYSELGVREGAKLLIGGNIPDMKGWFFEPTLFTDCTTEMRIANDEIFGPVVCILEAKDLNDAIRIANSVEYGLSTAIYTNDINKAFKAIEKLESGLTYINSSTIGSEVHLPFGGVKHTGNTREGGILGIDEFSEIKTVFIDYSGKLQRAQIDN
ncbi:MAG: aldehyde dehydrogenase family protein [Candidatus Aenigmatarchaeota archaeon]